MGLKDTIELMTSEDYKDRFKAEYLQLKIRHEKLCRTIAKATAGKLDFDPSAGLSILNEQLQTMEHYMRILEVRAELEEVDLYAEA